MDNFLRMSSFIKKKNGTTGNYTVIKSKTGEFYSDENSDILQLILYDGNYYDELQPANYQKRTKNRPQIKSTFEKYTINLDLSDFNNIDFDQLILEFHNPEEPNSGWIHCSYKNPEDNRKQVLRAYRNSEGRTIYEPYDPS